MTVSPQKRRWAFALTLLVVAGATLHAHDQDKEDALRAHAATKASRTVRTDHTPVRAAENAPVLELDRLDQLTQRRRASPLAADPFPVESSKEQLMAAANAATRATPEPPPPPQAPPIPFRFLGVQEADGVQVVFLEQQNRTHIARAGEVVADGWRFDRLTERSVIFTYVPLGEQRTLSIGGAS